MRTAFSALLSALAFAALLQGLSGHAGANERPNFIVIQTDDQSRSGTLGRVNLGNGRPPVPIMPRLQQLLVERGASWNNFYTPSPICSPSRASLLSGQLAHNNGVAYNNVANGRLSGGWPGWRQSPVYEDNFVTRLQVDYHTWHGDKVAPSGAQPATRHQGLANSS